LPQCPLCFQNETIQIVSKLLIYAVIPTAEEASKQKDLLKKIGFRVTILDNILTVLNRIKEKGE
jgi:hypothetical protein